MTMSITRTALVIVFAFGISVLTLFVVNTLPGPQWAVFLRCVSLTIGNIVTVVCSIYAWKRVNHFISVVFAGHNPLVRDEYRPTEGCARQARSRTDKRFKYAFFAFVLMSTSSWYMPYVPLFHSSYDIHWVPFITYVSLGFLLQFLMCLYFINALKLIRRAYHGLMPTDRGTNKQKRTELEIVDVPVSVVYALICCAYGLHVTSLPQQIISVEIPVVGLPKSFDGYRIAMLTDLHLGPTVGRKKLEQVVNIVNTIRADTAVIVGDLVDGPVQRLGQAAEIIKDIKVKGDKFFVTGNHEYYSPSVDQWLIFLRSLGFTVLHNEHVKVKDQSGDEYFYLAGTDDLQATRLSYTGHGYDLDKAVRSCDKDLPIILLAHQPNAAQRALDSEYNIRLVLSGHTHGGQMFPFTLLATPFNAFQKGLYKYKNGYVYVSQGTIYWGIPLRIGTFMEITEITLRAS